MDEQTHLGTINIGTMRVIDSVSVDGEMTDEEISDVFALNGVGAVLADAADIVVGIRD